MEYVVHTKYISDSENERYRKWQENKYIETEEKKVNEFVMKTAYKRHFRVYEGSTGKG